jgi:chromate transporter
MAIEPRGAALMADPRRAADVFFAFLKLGLTSFGGPVAHLGYFHAEFVVRRRWLDAQTYADLVALCQFLPGPASSQVGIAIGLLRARYLGALCAWLGFTLPSAIALTLFAFGLHSYGRLLGAGWLHGLKVAAVAVVALAVFTMARTLTPDRARATLAVVAAIIVLFAPTSWGQISAIAVGGVIGLLLPRPALQTMPMAALAVPVSRRAGVIALALFFALLIGLPIFAAGSALNSVKLFDVFYRAGSLVFGGGHVVLPLLQAAVVPAGWIDNDAFLAGYGAAQAVPGPLFTFAAYLGAAMEASPNGVAGAALCLVAIFLPSFLLVTGALPFWSMLRTKPAAQAALRGINAAVVGLLLAALYHPVWTAAILDVRDFALAIAALALLMLWQAPPWLVVALCALGGGLLS